MFAPSFLAGNSIVAPNPDGSILETYTGFSMSAFGIDNDGNFVTGSQGGSPAIRSYIGLSNTLSGDTFPTPTGNNLGTIGFDDDNNIVSYHNNVSPNTIKYKADYSGDVVQGIGTIAAAFVQYGGGFMDNGDLINSGNTGSGIINRYNGFSGSVIDSFDATKFNLVCGTDGEKIYTQESDGSSDTTVWDGFTGTSDYTFPNPSTRCTGIVSYKGFLYIGDLSNIYKMGNA